MYKINQAFIAIFSLRVQWKKKIYYFCHLQINDVKNAFDYEQSILIAFMQQFVRCDGGTARQTWQTDSEENVCYRDVPLAAYHLERRRESYCSSSWGRRVGPPPAPASASHSDPGYISRWYKDKKVKMGREKEKEIERE